MGVLIQPVNQGRVAANAEVRNRGREFFFGHAVPPETGYIIFNKYVILGKGLSEKLKKKRTLTQQYFSFHLINKYNKDIDNIFIGDFKSVFMATKNWVRLAGSPQWSDGTTGIFSSIDLSAYVDPLRNKGFLVTTAKVQIMMDTAVNGLMNDTASTPKTVAMQIATGTQTSTSGNLRPSNGKVLYHNFASYDNDAGVGPTQTWQQYEWDVTDLWPGGFYCVVDTLTASAISSADFTATLRMTYTIAGYQISISSNQLASFLVAQTQS